MKIWKIFLLKYRTYKNVRALLVATLVQKSRELGYVSSGSTTGNSIITSSFRGVPFGGPCGRKGIGTSGPATCWPSARPRGARQKGAPARPTVRWSSPLLLNAFIVVSIVYVTLSFIMKYILPKSIYVRNVR